MHRRALATQVLLGGGPEDDDDDCVVLTGSAPKANTCPVFTSPRKGPVYNQKVARVMASPAMQKVMGQHASTPEKQALAKEVVATVVAQSPDFQVASIFEYQKRPALRASSHQGSQASRVQPRRPPSHG